MGLFDDPRRLAFLTGGLGLVSGASQGRGMESLLPSLLTGLDTYRGVEESNYARSRQEELDEQERQREEANRRYTEALIRQMEERRGDTERSRAESEAQRKMRVAEHAEMLGELPAEEQRRLKLFLGSDQFPGLFYEAMGQEPEEDPIGERLKLEEGLLKLRERYSTPGEAEPPEGLDVFKVVSQRAKMYLDAARDPAGFYPEGAAEEAMKRASEDLKPYLGEHAGRFGLTGGGGGGPVDEEEVRAVRSALAEMGEAAVRREMKRKGVPAAVIDELLRRAREAPGASLLQRSGGL